MMKKKKKQTPVQVKIKDEESLFYTVEVFDKDGKLLERVSAPSKSYCRGWNQIINEYAWGGGPTIVNTSGVGKVPSNTSPHFLNSDAAIGAVAQGIRVGRGSTPVAIDDYALETVCGEGSGANEFKHQAMVFTAPSVDGSTISFTMQRLAVNDSGSDILVREIGCYNRFHPVATTEYLLGFRDVLPGILTIPDGGSIRVTYTLELTV
ncbi:hypothetical protein ES703_51167 [subsurface metagenome]